MHKYRGRKIADAARKERMKEKGTDNRISSEFFREAYEPYWGKANEDCVIKAVNSSSSSSHTRYLKKTDLTSRDILNCRRLHKHCPDEKELIIDKFVTPVLEAKREALEKIRAGVPVSMALPDGMTLEDLTETDSFDSYYGGSCSEEEVQMFGKKRLYRDLEQSIAMFYGEKSHLLRSVRMVVIKTSLSYEEYTEELDLFYFTKRTGKPVFFSCQKTATSAENSINLLRCGFLTANYNIKLLVFPPGFSKISIRNSKIAVIPAAIIFLIGEPRKKIQRMFCIYT